MAKVSGALIGLKWEPTMADFFGACIGLNKEPAMAKVSGAWIGLTYEPVWALSLERLLARKFIFCHLLPKVFICHWSQIHLFLLFWQNSLTLHSFFSCLGSKVLYPALWPRTLW